MGERLTVVFPHAGVSGGVERVVRDLLIFERDRRPTVFAGVSSEVEGPEHVVVRPRVSPASLRPAAFRAAARRALARRRENGTVISHGVNCPPGDVLWVHSVHAAWLASGGDAYIAGRPVPPQVRRALPRHRVLLALERSYFTNHRAKLILCTSQREIEDLVSHYGVARELMHVVPNGYDPALFNPTRRDDERTAVRQDLDMHADEISVLLVANEWHRKGLGVLLEAVARVHDPRVRLDLVGSRSPDAYRPAAARLGLEHALRWHGPSHDVGRFMAAADVFALPTTYEPFGLVIVEAMAAALPVITSRLAGAASAIDHGASGLLLADPRDPDELADALTHLLDERCRAGMGQRAIEAAAPYARDTVMASADQLIFGSS